MSIYQELSARWDNLSKPFLIKDDQTVYFKDLKGSLKTELSVIQPGDTVALIGDFHATSISTLIKLIDQNVIIVPLTTDTRHDHSYFFESAGVNFVIEGTTVISVCDDYLQHSFVRELRQKRKPGLVLFSTGTTGRPKAILHDFTVFLQRFETARPTLRTLNFMLFDHIGGINTLLHTLYNTGTIIAINDRNIDNVLKVIEKNQVELLPTTPTFLRMLLLSGYVPERIPKCLKIITYGTERMDQPTLDAFCDLLPDVDFRQTFGMSELGIVRVKSENRNSLFMKVGGEGIETRIDEGVLKIRSQTRMLGYLNAPSPFDDDGWYNTKDIVEQKGDYIKVVGRDSEVINIGGLKFMASQVERKVLEYKGVNFVKAIAKENPITGQHLELVVQTDDDQFSRQALKSFLKDQLPKHMVPSIIKLGNIDVGHRFKKL